VLLLLQLRPALLPGLGAAAGGRGASVALSAPSGWEVLLELLVPAADAAWQALPAASLLVKPAVWNAGGGSCCCLLLALRRLGLPPLICSAGSDPAWTHTII
jgi:hypothetical protein